MRRVALVVAGILGGSAGCQSSSSPGQGQQVVPPDVQAIIFLQRVARSGTGNVFDYTSYQPGGRIVKLEPPSADGKLTWVAQCNTAGADLTITADRLMVGKIASTAIGCEGPAIEQDNDLAAFFESGPTWHLDGHRLTSNESGEVQLAERDRQAGRRQLSPSS